MTTQQKSQATPSLVHLAQQLARLPGIGPKSAQRIAHHLIRIPKEEAQTVADAIQNALENIILCSKCQNLAESEPCHICSDHRRDESTLCVVEDPADIAAVESTNSYKGRYHVLHGALSPVNGITPSELRLDELAQRLETEPITELVLATNPNVEGEATATYIVTRLARPGLRITRPARGLSIGGSLESTDQTTLKRALQAREELSG